MATFFANRLICFRPHSLPGSRRLLTSPSHSLARATDSNKSPQDTHFKITLRRSAISLGKKVKGTLVSLGIHRRMQTVYHPHSPVVAGKILRVKELVEVENVPEDAVRTKQEQKRERRPAKGYHIVGSRLRGGFVDS